MGKRTQEQLAKDWHMSPRTLEQWRWLGKGPKFLKIGARVLYRDEDVENYEAAQICQNTSGPIPSGAGDIAEPRTFLDTDEVGDRGCAATIGDERPGDDL